VQLPAQLVASLEHRLLEQGSVVDAVQFPEPLQTDWDVSLPTEQLAGVQTVELSGKTQELIFTPSHWAVHFPEPPHAARGLTGAPFTALHFPTEPASLHD
jgi:hypothetical protein